MPGRSRGHGDGGGEQPGHPPSRPRGTPAAARSVHEAQEATAEAARAGRPGAGAAGAGGRGAQTDPLVTHKTGETGGTPAGEPTRINPSQDESVRRSLSRENSGAEILAAGGYQIKQNPTSDEVALARTETGDTGSTRSKPDYLLEGRVFDCYSPAADKPVRGVWFEVEHKVVVKNQAQRIVVNLQDWTGDMTALRQQFRDWPIDGLKEVKAITPDGDIVQIIPER